MARVGEFALVDARHGYRRLGIVKLDPFTLRKTFLMSIDFKKRLILLTGERDGKSKV